MLSRLLRVAQDAVARRNTAAEEEGTESGFTLIELMVVLLIMAILLAIAIPTFLGVKGGAQDRAAQSNLTNGLTSAKALYSSVGSYTTTNASFVATMATQEPELTFTTGSATAAGNVVSFDISTDGQQIILVNYSPDNGGTCWAVSDNDGSAAALGGAPAGNEYAGWAWSTINLCSATVTATTLGSSPPTNFWNSAYPTTLTSP